MPQRDFTKVSHAYTVGRKEVETTKPYEALPKKRDIRLFDEKVPHEGYDLMLKIARSLKSFFVFTSNIDGYFSRTGFPAENIFESHGNVNVLQCIDYRSEVEEVGEGEEPFTSSCPGTIFSSTTEGSKKWFKDAKLSADMKITDMSVIPKCPRCQKVSRPNISHCTDHPEDICYERKGAQERRFHEWIKTHRNEKLVVLEVGCGTSAHSLRDESELLCEELWRNKDCKIIRIDPDDCRVPKGHVGIRLKAKDALKRLSQAYFNNENEE